MSTPNYESFITTLFAELPFPTSKHLLQAINTPGCGVGDSADWVEKFIDFVEQQLSNQPMIYSLPRDSIDRIVRKDLQHRLFKLCCQYDISIVTKPAPPTIIPSFPEHTLESVYQHLEHRCARAALNYLIVAFVATSENNTAQHQTGFLDTHAVEIPNKLLALAVLMKDERRIQQQLKICLLLPNRQGKLITSLIDRSDTPNLKTDDLPKLAQIIINSIESLTE